MGVTEELSTSRQLRSCSQAGPRAFSACAHCEHYFRTLTSREAAERPPSVVSQIVNLIGTQRARMLSARKKTFIYGCGECGSKQKSSTNHNRSETSVFYTLQESLISFFVISTFDLHVRKVVLCRSPLVANIVILHIWPQRFSERPGTVPRVRGPTSTYRRTDAATIKPVHKISTISRNICRRHHGVHRSKKPFEMATY